jgi:hypothetical protein
MQPVKNIQFKFQCPQQINRMQAQPNGWFCQSCQKSVTDFSAMGNDEIIKKLTTAGHLCGSFKEGQMEALNAYLAQDIPPKFNWKQLSIAAAFISILPFTNAVAKPPVPVKTAQGPHFFKHSAVDSTVAQKYITGKVIDQADKTPLRDVKVNIDGTKIYTTTDQNGEYRIKIEENKNVILRYTFPRFEPQRVAVNTSKGTRYDVSLKHEVMMLGEIVITPPLYKQVYDTVARPLKKLFCER